jgi:predicted nuclease of restriction endonuclease-like (RecB) superfamily
MATRKKTTKTPVRAAVPARGSRGKKREGASFPVAPARAGLPRDYAETLSAIKRRIQQERLRVVLAANSAMVLLYWDIGRMILDRQQREGWGARVIDRLAEDLREGYPDMRGFSARNLLFMRSFAEACPDAGKVKQPVSQLPWGHVIRLLQRVKEPEIREWYIRESIEHGWSRSILELQIDGHAHERHGQALTNFKATLPPADSDMAAQVFKDPYLFDFPGTADPRREREVEEALVEHISKDRIVVEYALRDLKKPIGVAGWETTIVEKLPEDLKGSLPTVEELEAELGREDNER